MKSFRSALVLLFAGLILWGCDLSTDSFDPDLSQLPTEIANIPKSAYTVTNSDLWYHDLTVGDGATAQPNETATVHYTGWLLNGTKFDSSVDRDQPFSFTVANDNVITGWHEGVEGMKVGGTRILVIPSNLAYGNRGVGPIPPNATLVFKIELLALTGSGAMWP